MKNKRIFAKVIAIVALVAVAVTCVSIFAACNKKKTKTVSDIFKDRASFGEITSYQKAFELQPGWEVYTDSRTSTTGSQTVTQYSDVGYIEDLDAFVVSSSLGGSKKLSVVKCNDDKVYYTDGPKGVLFAESEGIRSLRYKDGLFVCLFNDGTAGAFDSTGRVVLSSEKLGGYGSSEYGYGSTLDGKIDDIIKVLSGDLIAVNGNYDHLGKKGYTSIYRTTRDGSRDKRGELVCRIKNEGEKLSYVLGFDNKYVSVVGNTAGDYLYSIPAHAPSSGAADLSPSSRGTVSKDSSKTNYASEITYIGGGKFYIHEEWEVKESEEYTYYDGEDYIFVKRRIYTPDNDASKDYSGNKLFINMTNNHYDESKIGVATSSYLNDGYTYVAFGVTIIEANGKKIGLYDQFIVDSGLNIVLSLTGNYGIELKDQERDKVGFYDMIMFGVDGYYYNPLSPSKIKIYDKNGKVIGQNDRSNAIMQELNNNIMIVQTPNGTSTTTFRYGAYDIYGNELVPFDYDELAPFRGPYTIGRRYGKAENDGEYTSNRYLRLIGPNGKEVTEVDGIDKDGNVSDEKIAPFSDIAYTGTARVENAIYKAGCYMFRVDSGEKDGSNIIYKYGVRNFNPSADSCVIIPARMEAGSVLYSPTSSPSNLFVFEKITSADKQTFNYIIYRLV